MHNQIYKYTFQVGDLVEILTSELKGRIGLVVELNTDLPENHILHVYNVLVDGRVLDLFSSQDLKKV
jgi:hypothetical protein